MRTVQNSTGIQYPFNHTSSDFYISHPQAKLKNEPIFVYDYFARDMDSLSKNTKFIFTIAESAFV